jgi:hypothetical protein
MLHPEPTPAAAATTKCNTNAESATQMPPAAWPGRRRQWPDVNQRGSPRHGVPTWCADQSTPPLPSLAACMAQAEATCWGTPRVESFQLEGSVAAVDLLQLAAAAPSAAAAAAPSSADSPALLTAGSTAGGSLQPPPAFVDGAPLRLRVSGGVRLSAVREENAAARRQAGLTADQAGYLFTGAQQDGINLLFVHLRGVLACVVCSKHWPWQCWLCFHFRRPPKLLRGLPHQHQGPPPPASGASPTSIRGLPHQHHCAGR